MVDLQALHKSLAQYQANIGVSFRLLRYNGNQIGVNPRIQHKGLNPAYKSTAAIRDAVEVWETYLDKTILTESGITAATALTDFDFGTTNDGWEISEDNGSTWEGLFILDIPRQETTRYIVQFARGITGANLTVTYEIGGGTFTTDPDTGNPVESTTEGTFYGTVSQGRSRTQFEDSAGLSPGRVYLEGFFADVNGNPTEMPTDLQLMRPWPAVLDVGNGVTVQGTFLTLIHAEDADGRQEGRRGSTLQGWFATVGSGR